MLTKGPKGTKDMLPAESRKWNYVEEVFKDVCRSYGFNEIRTPMFEHTELFTRGVGDTTDIVQKEMYTFLDHGDRSITLKPEGTSPVVRSFVEHKMYADAQPTKLYYVTPCFRYERPQSGRLREFHQFGVETFGSHSMMADAEIISLAYSLIKRLGLKQVELRINSVGCPKCRKEHRRLLKDFLNDKKDLLCETCQTRLEKNPMRIIDCKSPDCQHHIEGAPMMADHLCHECREDFHQLQHYLNSMNIPYTVDKKIVRGLDYYTKTAFEWVTSAAGAQGTLCGGGRYDHLIEEVGGPDTPGVGFGLGIERLLMVMEAEGVYLPEEQGDDVYIAAMGEAAIDKGLSILTQLRELGLRCQMDMMNKGFKGQFKQADRLKSKLVLIIGEDELERNEISIKELATSSQYVVSMDDMKEKVLEALKK